MAHARPRPRNWKQLLLKLGVFLLLGAIVNVAVASYFASTYVDLDPHTTAATPAELNWLRSLGWNTDAVEIEVERTRTIGQSLDFFSPKFKIGQNPLARPHEEFHFRYGLPLLCFADGSQLVEPRDSFLDQNPSEVGGETRFKSRISLFTIALDDDEHRIRIPINPLVIPLAINTIFYAAILWLLWIATGKIRRLIRVKRHRCPACGYQIAKGVGPRCSECGHPLPWHSQCSAA